MELYQEILAKMLESQEAQLFSKLDPQKIVEMKCYQALRKIKAILEDDSLKDRQCFAQIEEIVCLFESLGSGGGTRHDFG